MHRLKTRPQFQATMAAGTLARTAHFALHGLPLDTPHPLFAHGEVWLGALVPKRWARRAVTRNALRRQIYAMAQQLGPTLPPAAYVVRLRAAFDRGQFVSAASRALKQAARAELELLFSRLPRPAAQP